MALNTEITSLNAGAPDIKYTGTEGPQNPQASNIEQFIMEQWIQQAFVRDVDSIVHKLNSTFQQDLKDEAEAESIFIA